MIEGTKKQLFTGFLDDSGLRRIHRSWTPCPPVRGFPSRFINLPEPHGQHCCLKRSAAVTILSKSPKPIVAERRNGSRLDARRHAVAQEDLWLILCFTTHRRMERIHLLA
jgi:hypothetical protein